MFQLGLSHQDVQYSAAKTFIETRHCINSDTNSSYMSMYDMVGAVPDTVTTYSLLCVREKGCKTFGYAANESLCRLGEAVIDRSIDSVECSRDDEACFAAGKHNRA